ncbi:arylamine N-acetyltransferase [Streptomyces sp. NPDC092369]|uniref:arylamine N-acetyltransferase family protein n=1 Tax=Streptomyces sp. NPDC092369 TaxID=3366015 RepID=UPI00380B0FDF
MESVQIDAYLRRLGIERPAGAGGSAGGSAGDLAVDPAVGPALAPTVDLLRDLHLRHLRAVPFENLSVHLGEEIVLEEARLVEKVVGARRGGFCYELNGAFGALLTTLGFEVTLLAARVHGGEGQLGIPYDHLALRVRTVDGSEWLADVGFGAHSHYPLAFGERGEQADPGGVFRIVEVEAEAVAEGDADAEAGAGAGAEGEGAGAEGVGEGGGAPKMRDLDVVRNGEAQYRMEVRPRLLRDFVAGAWWHSTSPDSHFTRSLVCSRVTEDGGRITLSGRTFKVTGGDGAREERELGTDEEVLAVYRERFGIELARVPTVRKTDQYG